MAPPGTTFKVDFWVWDGAGARALAKRYVTITDPCPTNDGDIKYHFCLDPASSRCEIMVPPPPLNTLLRAHQARFFYLA